MKTFASLVVLLASLIHAEVISSFTTNCTADNNLVPPATESTSVTDGPGTSCAVAGTDLVPALNSFSNAQVSGGASFTPGSNQITLELNAMFNAGSGIAAVDGPGPCAENVGSCPASASFSGALTITLETSGPPRPGFLDFVGADIWTDGDSAGSGAFCVNGISNPVFCCDPGALELPITLGVPLVISFGGAGGCSGSSLDF